MITLLNKKKFIDWFEGLRARSKSEDLEGLHKGIEWLISRTSTTRNSIDGKIDNMISVYFFDKGILSSHLILVRADRKISDFRQHIETYIDEGARFT